MKKILGFCSVLLVCIIVIFVLFSPRPLIDDVDQCEITLLQYNPHFNEEEQVEADIIPLTDYNEAELLECLSYYKERRTLIKAEGGFWIGDLELQIMINTGKESKILLLGNLNFSYENYGKTQFKILDADSLRLELLNMISVHDNGIQRQVQTND
jgi:hypothetical protein